jgi:aminopeptidase N
VCAALAAAGCTSSSPHAGPSAHPSVPAATATSTTPAPGAATSGDSLFPEDGNGGYDVTHYAITISYDPATQKLTGANTITATATQALSRFDLDLHDLTVASVTVANHPATFSRSADKLAIVPSRSIPLGATFTTTIRYGGTPSPYNDPSLGFEGFIPETDGALAQGEPQVAASWYPVNDRPTDKATYDITITAPTALAAISNGVLDSKRSSGANTTWHWVESSPMASYLALVAIGKYRVTTTAHDGMPVVLAVADALPRMVDTALAETPAILDFLETQFGPYPFDAVGGVVHNDPRIRFALENQTRPTYAPAFFAGGPDVASTVIAHELTHQWFGDNVTVGDWSDVWLNEGFATYAEWLWSGHEGRDTPKQKFDALYKATSFPTNPPASPTVRSVFGPSSYLRGAATLEALRITVGGDTFWRIVRGWAKLHAGGNATTAEFVAYANDISGRSLDSFLHAWLYDSGKPPYPTRLK